MNKILRFLVAGVLALHGLIHLMGSAAYLKLAEVEGLPYKTTVLAGRWDLGETGTALFGFIWGLAAIGFVLAAVGMIVKQAWWKPLLLAVTLVSLVLGVLDWDAAKAGVVVNGVILIGLWALAIAKPSQPLDTARG